MCTDLTARLLWEETQVPSQRRACQILIARLIHSSTPHAMPLQYKIIFLHCLLCSQMLLCFFSTTILAVRSVHLNYCEMLSQIVQNRVWYSWKIEINLLYLCLTVHGSQNHCFSQFLINWAILVHFVYFRPILLPCNIANPALEAGTQLLKTENQEHYNILFSEVSVHECNHSAWEIQLLFDLIAL